MSGIFESDEIEGLEEGEIPLLVLSNDPTELKIATLEFLYKSLSYGQLAYMDGKHPETGEIVPLLVGLEPTEDGKVRIFPLARMIMGTTGEFVKYLVPNGTGNYSEVEPGEPVDLFRVDGTGEEGQGTPEGFDKKQIN